MSDLNSVNRYDIMQNKTGDILIMIGYKEGGPENPKFIYDGSDIALLYRSKESAIALKDIAVEARSALKDVSEVLVVEFQEDDVVREYLVPMRIVKDVRSLK